MGTGISYGLGRLSSAAGPLIIAALYNSSGYQSVFIFIAGTWLFGAALLAIFGPKTRQAGLAAAQATAAAPIDGTATAAGAVQPGRRAKLRHGYHEPQLPGRGSRPGICLPYSRRNIACQR